VRALPDWEAVRKEMRQKGVTLRLVWMEYFEEHPDGYQYTQYCEYYRRWKKARVEPIRPKYGAFALNAPYFYWISAGF
jgi:transposase